MVGKKTEKKVVKKKISSGVMHVYATFNNTIVSITDTKGNLVSWSSTGKLGFKGSRKATPYAAQMTAQDAIEKARGCGLQTVSIEVRGPGVGRESALRALEKFSDIGVTYIVDKTYHPHNGCRPRKRRRM